MVFRYIYFEKAIVTAATALPLLYAAKKYLLTGLVAECVTVLEKELSVDTVCTLLDQSLSLGEIELQQKSLNFISTSTHRVFNTEGFVHLSHDALEEIVSLDFLSGFSERQVYENCMRWARHQLRETGNDSPSDEDLRNKMGNVLYRIRFPTMTLEDFAELTAQSAVLTLQEKYDVHVYMAVGTKLESLKFGTKNRRGANYVANRFDRIHGEWRGIAIRTMHGGHSFDWHWALRREKSTHGVTLEVLRENETLSKTVTKMVSDGSRKLVKIQLENPVHVQQYVHCCGCYNWT